MPRILRRFGAGAPAGFDPSATVLFNRAASGHATQREAANVMGGELDDAKAPIWARASQSAANALAVKNGLSR
jgi:hypothetical protein